MKPKLIAAALEQKISDIGVVSANEYRKKEKGLEKASFCASGGCPDWAKSIVVCIFSYFSGAEKGNISRYAQGEDYHIVAKEKLEVLAEILRKNGFRAECFADTGVLFERLLARLSGLAFSGKNQMAISPEFGSYFFVGYILTDCELPADSENTSTCAGCGKCISVCPLGALSEDGFCQEKCLSYITQKKGELSPEEAEAMKNAGTLWGCDLCQEVCPHNQNLPITEIAEFRENLTVNLTVDENISSREFRELYKNKAFSWRGKGVLLRNQEIVSIN